MNTGSQADAVRQIEEALLALRLGHGRGPGGRPGGRPGLPGMGGPGGRPPWGDGPPPWVVAPRGEGESEPGDGPRHEHGRRHGPHERGLGGGARIRLLEFLAAAAPEARLGISEVAEAIGVDQPRASRLVNDAATRGLVSRGVDPSDARRSVVAITDAGRTLLDQVRDGRRTAVTEALAGFTPEETEAFAALFTRFAAQFPRG